MALSQPAAAPHSPWYFRHRSAVIIALAGVLVLWPWWRLPLDALAASAGSALLALGLLLRVWCIRQVGGAARKQTVPKAALLVTWGPYGLVRNPIYLANMLLFSAFTVLAGLAWALPVLVGIMWLQYAFTVRFEERFLGDTFGEAFESYCRDTPRWLPRLRRKRRPEGFAPYPLRKLLKRERSLFFQVAGGLAAILLLRVLSANGW